MAEVTMPQLGETVTEGTVTRWLKSVGEHVERDEVLFEVSTDKVDSEVPSPASGTLAEIRVPEGETVDVGAVVAVINEGGSEPQAAVSTAPTGSESAVSTAPSGTQSAASFPPPSGEPSQTAANLPPPAATFEPPAAPATAAYEPPAALATPVYDEPQVAQASLSSFQAGEASRPQVAPEAPQVQKAQVSQETQGVQPGLGSQEASGSQDGLGEGQAGTLLSPVVRKLVREYGIDPSLIRGSGVGGRVTREDVLAYLDSLGQGARTSSPAHGSVVSPSSLAAPVALSSPTSSPAFQSPTATPATTSSSAPTVPVAQPPTFKTPTAPRSQSAVRPGPGDEVVPFNNVRRRTAEHMVRSKAISAHSLTAIEVDFEQVEKVRRLSGERFKAEEGLSLTYLPFIARATVDALRQHPHLNASVGADELVLHRDIHLGIAVDIEGTGLIVPVVHNAESMTVRGLARAIADLANRARSRQLSPDDVSGGTFTISNPGPFGTLITIPIINQPQVGILSTDSVRKRPVVLSSEDGSDTIGIRPIGVLAISFDHRVIDGAYAARFLRTLKSALETRDWSAEL
jgi:pyruvate dehydrogenase E2 component (dihydrolipoamide acetyltransferase)